MRPVSLAGFVLGIPSTHVDSHAKFAREFIELSQQAFSVGVGFGGDEGQTLVQHRKLGLRENVFASVHDVLSGLRCDTLGILVIGFGAVAGD